MKAVIGFISVLLFLFFLHFAKPVFAGIQFNIGSTTLLDTEINLTASISGLTANSCSAEGKCYLQGTLRRVGSSYYFGQTQNNAGSWIDYISSPELEYIQSTLYSFQPNSGSWSGQLKMRFFTEDTEYKGPGDYELKLRRFSGKSENPSGESDPFSLALTVMLPTPTPTLTPAPTSAPTDAPTPTPTKTPTSTPSHTPTPTSKISVSPTPKRNLPTGVLGKSTQSGEEAENILIANESTNKGNNWSQKIFIFIGVVFIAACAILVFWKIKKGKLTQDE